MVYAVFLPVACPTISYGGGMLFGGGEGTKSKQGNCSLTW